MSQEGTFFLILKLTLNVNALPWSFLHGLSCCHVIGCLDISLLLVIKLAGECTSNGSTDLSFTLMLLYWVWTCSPHVPLLFLSFFQRKALVVLFQHWFSVAAEETSVASELSVYLREVRKATPSLLAFLVNFADDNGNTVLHYSVSHCNYSIVGLLLDTGYCFGSCTC